MSFKYKQNQWMVENVPLLDIAQTVGTPCYVYSKAVLENNFIAFQKSLQTQAHQLHYAVKANSNLSVLNVLAKLNAGFDIVSQGELERVLAAGGDSKKIIFSGVGKTKLELQRALEVSIGYINIESDSELALLNELARKQNTTVSICLRTNPDIDSKSHPYISTGLKENKFGISVSDIMALAGDIKQTFSNLKLEGLACHIGSQIKSLDPFNAAMDKMLELIDHLAHKGIKINILNMGGGLGVDYEKENLPSIEQYIASLLSKIKHKNITLLLEPGRAIVANAGVLLTQVHHLKKTSHKNFAIMDAGMNDFIRPALYQAYQEIVEVKPNPNLETSLYDVVGPLCETSDFIGKNRQLALEQGTVLAVLQAGAYGFSMSSNYNSRPRPAEVMVDNDRIFVVRSRETLAQLFSLEKIIS